MSLLRSSLLSAVIVVSVAACDDESVAPDPRIEPAHIAMRADSPAIAIDLDGREIAVEVITLDNFCVAPYHTDVDVERGERLIIIRPQVRRLSDRVCDDIPDEVAQVVTVDALADGTWTVRVIGIAPHSPIDLDTWEYVPVEFDFIVGVAGDASSRSTR